MNQDKPQFASLPRHIAIIMDGNGRWAKQRMAPRVLGHQKAIKSVRESVEAARELGVEVLTLYAFSTENWQRPQKEVDTLMKLFKEYLRKELSNLHKNGIRLRLLGRRDRLPDYVHQPLEEALEKTKDNQGMVLCLAVDYGSRDEMIRMMQDLATQAAAGSLKAEEVDENWIGDHLDTAGLPDPDLIIRTSGEIRLSNFLLWQAAYAEFYFTDILWPDFRKSDLHKAIEVFNLRTRRMGNVDAP